MYIINVVGSTSDVEIKKTTNLETNLHGLAKFANYSVRVLAFTSAGEGVRSSPVHCTTEEDGESRTVILSVNSCTIFTITWCICVFWWSFSGHCWFTCIYIQSQWLFLPEMISTAAKCLLCTETQTIEVQDICAYFCSMRIFFLFRRYVFSAYSFRPTWTNRSIYTFLLLTVPGLSKRNLPCAGFFWLSF